MNKTRLYIAGIILIAVTISSTALVMRASSNDKQSKKTDITYFDSVTGQHNNASITYTSYNPNFTEETVTLETGKNKTPKKADIISYNITLEKQDDISITINKNKNLISFKGLTPREKISVIQDSKYLISNIPSDWSGKITLTDTDIAIDNDLCFELLSQNITACHAVAGNKGGVS